MNIQHLNQYQLSKRWGITQKTLENWRWKSRGPAFLKIGGRVMYRLQDIEQFEAENLHNTSRPHQASSTSNQGVE